MLAKYKALIAAFVFFLSGATFAQSKIQCYRSEDGTFQAVLIWQNTLGAARANEICRGHANSNGLNPLGQAAIIDDRGLTKMGELPNSSAQSRFDPSTIQRAQQAIKLSKDQAGQSSFAAYEALW